MNHSIGVRDIIMWNRIGNICDLLCQRLGLTGEEALDLFYNSRAAEHLHNAATGLYLYGDNYIADEIILEHQ